MAQNFRYSYPRRQNYISSFVPLPLDYLDKNIQRQQTGYDQSVSMLTQAEDLYGGLQVSGEDIPEKNRLIEETFGDIDKVVSEQYGDDYYRALPEIQKRIAKLRRNPFFTLAPQYMEARKKEQELRDKFGADAFAAKTLRGVSIRDPETGEYRPLSQTGYEILDRGQGARVI